LVNDEVAKFGQVNTSIVVSDFIKQKFVDVKKIMNDLNSSDFNT
jgi:hypothetical protein